MESTLGRRHARSHYNTRRKRMHPEEKDRIGKLLKQLIVCAAIFVIIFTIKNIDSNFTNYISTKMAIALTTDADFGAAVEQAKQIFSSLNVTNEKLRAVFNSSGTNSETIPVEMKDKVYDWNLLKDKGFEPPVMGNLESTFGSRINPVTKQNEFHEGIDISANAGDDIRAVLNGVVVEASSNDSMGNYVKIKHDDDIYSLYAHASSLNVEKGQEVKKSDVIAKVGSTGTSTGNHLHLEIRKGEQMVNPQKLFNYESVADSIQ